MLYLIHLIAFLLFPIKNDSKDQNSTITIQITNGLPKKGKILVALYNSEKGFPGNDKLSYKSMKENILDNGTVSIILSDIPDGNYAISVFQDENNDGILNTNIVGIPKEGYGFSNDAHNPFGPPNYKDCVFTHKSVTKVPIKLKRW